MRKNARQCIAIFSVLLCSSLLVSSCGSGTTPEERVREQLAKQAEPGDTAEGVVQHAESDQEAGASEKNSADEVYESPVDFASLQKQNADICAWLYIPDTDISYPVLQHETDDTFYLDHDSLRNESVSGSLFLDSYNTASFDDPVMVVYGHHMKSGAYFGELQSYYDTEESFTEHSLIELYLPEEEREYEVFAAVPYDSIHLLYTYDFSDVAQFYVFFDRVYELRAFQACTVKEKYPAYGEKILILSTCLEGDNNRRFLVMAKEVTK